MNDQNNYDIVESNNDLSLDELSESMQVEAARAMKQVEAQIVLAKKFPRNTMQSFKNIIESCKRPTFAKKSLYLYPRGGTTVTGPSIRMAEMIAQNWGNLEFGVNELSNEKDYSIVQSFAWDLENNVRQVKTFKVSHYRHTRKGKYKLTDPRDIYESVANNGARRLRACILGVIPQDIIEDAENQCKKTLNSVDKEIPIADRIKIMLMAFDKFGVSQEMIEEKYQMKMDQLRDGELAELRGIFNSLKDGMSKKQDWFKFGKEISEKTNEVNDKFGVKKDEKKEA